MECMGAHQADVAKVIPPHEWVPRTIESPCLQQKISIEKKHMRHYYKIVGTWTLRYHEKTDKVGFHVFLSL